jgi:ribosomal protein S12 methylthiotransferase accessory factor
LQATPLPDDVLITARYDQWPHREPPIDPLTWVLFHPEQYRQEGFPFQALTRQSECAWVCCRQALTGDPWWVPAEMVYLHIPQGHRFCPGLSTGLACGRTGDPMLLRGLQEVIERDAVVGAWWGRYALEEHPVIDVLTQLGEDARDRVIRVNLTYRCFRVITPFSDHVTMVTLEGEDREGYCFSIGSACRETRRASWMKSLLEAIHDRHYVRYLKGQVAAGAMKMGAWPTSFAEHAVYYSVSAPPLAGSRSLPIFKSLRSHPASANPQAEEPLPCLVERLGPQRPVLFRSMTPPALASENLGWHVLRVVVPGLQPLHGHHAYPHLGGPLWAPRSWSDWQTMPPHPFP